MKQVLIIEDDPAAARLAVELARSLGYEPHVFYSVERFEEYLRATPDRSRIAALILDILLPERDAIECLCHMHLEGIAIPTILVSSGGSRYFETIRMLATAIRQRIVAVIHKPLTRSALSDALNWEPRI